MDTTDQIHTMLDMKVWAVVGATDNPDKFGYKIFKLLKKADYTVFPVNPGLESVQGEKCYASLADLPVKPEAVNFVVPPKVGEAIVAECAALGIKNAGGKWRYGSGCRKETGHEYDSQFMHSG